jgi:YegS/Rv2252/BmrU family lipid kinase
MRICVIFNPTARGDKARRLTSRLHSLMAECVLRPTTGPGTAPGLVATAVAEGFDTIVAAGGDGTVNEVVNGLAATAEGLADRRLGVIPLGTVNVFARELKLPLQPEAAWRVILEGRETRMDLPWVAWRENGREQRRRFAQLAGAGLDSLAIASVNWESKKRVGPLAYLWAGLRTLGRPQPELTVAVEGRTTTGQFVLAGNGQRYGYFRIFPQADNRDGVLDLRILRRVGWGKLARFLGRWLTRPYAAPPDEVWFRAARFTVTADRPVPFELDGDNVGWLPAEFGVEPRALRVIVPADPSRGGAS